jgi:hypothetical protein
MSAPHDRIRLTRRAALAGLGASGAASFFLRPFFAQAQSGLSPQRILLIHRPCGTVPDKWWPTGGVTDWTSSSILSQFDQLRSDMVILRGVDCPRMQNWLGDKGGAAIIALMAPAPNDKGPTDLHVWPVLPGYTVAQQNDTNAKFFTSTDKTIDQLFLERIPGLMGTRFPSVQLTASSSSADSSQDCCDRVVSYSKPDALAQFPTPLWPEYRPSVAAANIIAGAFGMKPSDLASRALDKSLLDFVSADLNGLRARVPASQRPKVDAHLSALRDLEKSLNPGLGPACVQPTLGPLPTPANGISTIDAQYLEICKQQMQVIKTIFACDLTRTLSFTYAWVYDEVRFINVLPPGTIIDSGGHHDISHNGGTGYAQAMEEIEKFYAQMTASLLLDMKNTPDVSGSGSLLDNTLVVYWNHFCIGNASTIEDIPIILFGGKFLNLQGGKYLQFGKNAHTMADFWVETAQTWGFKQMTSYGAPMWNKGRMPGIYG